MTVLAAVPERAGAVSAGVRLLTVVAALSGLAVVTLAVTSASGIAIA